MQQPPSQRPDSTLLDVRPDLISGIIREFQITWDLFTNPCVPMYIKVLPVLIGLVYVLIPTDLLPDSLLGRGQLDDLVLLAAMVVAFRFLADASIGAVMMVDLTHPLCRHPAPGPMNAC